MMGHGILVHLHRPGALGAKIFNLLVDLNGDERR
jgi:hypothetical protein